MAASAWTVFNQAKHNIGLGNFDLSGDTFNMILVTSGASAALLTNVSTLASLGSVTVSQNGTDAKTALGSLVWTGTGSANAATRKWDVADPVFTANTSALGNVRYAVIYESGGDKLLCYAALSIQPFNVAIGNTLTVQMATGGVFTLA